MNRATSNALIASVLAVGAFVLLSLGKSIETAGLVLLGVLAFLRDHQSGKETAKVVEEKKAVEREKAEAVNETKIVTMEKLRLEAELAKRTTKPT